MKAELLPAGIVNGCYMYLADDVRAVVEPLEAEVERLRIELAEANKPPERPEHLYNKVYAATGAEPASAGNVSVGVVAHCQCGNSFPDDIECCAPPPKPPVLGEPLTEVLYRQHYIAVATKNNSVYHEGYIQQGTSGNGFLAVNDSWTYYDDPRPLPVLPEPEEPSVPKFKGTVRNTVTGKVYFVLWPKGARPSLVSPAGHTLHYDGFPPKNHELYNHPEVENTPELIKALEGQDDG